MQRNETMKKQKELREEDQGKGDRAILMVKRQSKAACTPHAES